MSSPVQPRLTAEQYLERERAAGFKSECIHGVIYAITHSSSGYPGASREHNLITLNIGRERSAQLRGRPCETYASDMRVKVGKTGACVYPDVVVVCGEPRFEDAYVDTMTNPTLIVEVLSPSTQAFDRGRSSPTTGAFLRSRSISSWRSTSAASSVSRGGARSGC